MLDNLRAVQVDVHIQAVEVHVPADVVVALQQRRCIAPERDLQIAVERLGIAGAAAGIAKILFVGFLILAVISLFTGLGRRTV